MPARTSAPRGIHAKRRGAESENGAAEKQNRERERDRAPEREELRVNDPESEAEARHDGRQNGENARLHAPGGVVGPKAVELGRGEKRGRERDHGDRLVRRHANHRGADPRNPQQERAGPADKRGRSRTRPPRGATSARISALRARESVPSARPSVRTPT